MVKDTLKKPVLTAFTPNGECVAILSADGTAKIWNTNDGHLLAEWKPSDEDTDVHYSCIACSFIGKKRRKEQGTCMLAFGTAEGTIQAVDVSTGETKWTTSYPSGVCGLLFANKGRLLYAVGLNGMASEINTETGECLKEFKISKKSISTLAFSHDEKYLAVFSNKLRVINWENGKEVLRFPDDLGNVHLVSISNDAKALVTFDPEDKNLHVWRCDLDSGNVSSGPTLPLRHAPSHLECHNGYSKEDDLIVLAVSGSGPAYVWNLNSSSEDEIQPTKIMVKTANKENKESPKKKRSSIIASSLLSLGDGKQMKALVTYGSIDHPEFNLLDIINAEENIVLNVGDETDSVQKLDNLSEATVTTETKKSKKRQATSDPDLPPSTIKVDVDQGETADGVLVNDDLSEPTMGEKLAGLSLLDEKKSKDDTVQESSVPAKPPSADSVHVLLKQALNADDRALLLDCLYTQDEKVIRKSIAQLNPSNVLKLLHSLTSIIESRGAILACALPWVKCLLLQHASGIVSQESSLRALNSLYQLIESRVSIFKSAVQLSSCLDMVYAGVIDDEEDQVETVPVIYEDNDDSEEESEENDAMDTDQDDKHEKDQSDEEASDGDSDVEGSDDMMDS